MYKQKEKPLKRSKSSYAVIAISLAVLVTATTSAEVVEDFSNQPEERWEYFGDNVMGGVSAGNAIFVKENGNQYVRLIGRVSTQNNGGFIQVRRLLTSDLPFDTRGFELQVIGNGERYYLHLRSNRTFLPWQYYQVGFDTTEEWQSIRVELEEFRRSGRMLPQTIEPEAIRSIAIVAFGREHQADVSVANISIYCT